MSTDNPDVVDIVTEAIAGAIGAMRVVGVGYASGYNPLTQSVTVTSALNFMYWDEEEEELVEYSPSPVPNCPVLHLSAGGFFSAMPIKDGDVGIILTADRSLDGWKNQGNKTNSTKGGGRFDFKDSMFLPVGRSFARALEFADKQNEKWVWGEETPTGFRFELGDGKFEFGTPTVRFLQQVVSVIDEAQKTANYTGTSVVTTLLGPQPLSNAGALAAVAIQLAQIRALINLIRGT